MQAQLIALFAFGLVISGIAFIGMLQAREVALREARTLAEKQARQDSERPLRLVK